MLLFCRLSVLFINLSTQEYRGRSMGDKFVSNPGEKLHTSRASVLRDTRPTWLFWTLLNLKYLLKNSILSNDILLIKSYKPYTEVTGCFSVCVSRISLTTEPIWFSFTVNLFKVQVRKSTFLPRVISQKKNLDFIFNKNFPPSPSPNSLRCL